jgi:2-polyprenyl-3-methyl-5-hydroxy-6-metoxy-1,4-benzoquinol methylase
VPEAEEMNLEKAIDRVREKFPFKQLFDTFRSEHADRARIVSRYVRPGDRILDFGSGPCALAAILQSLGYRCSAFDDLQDPWHLQEGSRAAILKFAKETGVEFAGSDGEGLPYSPESFSMVTVLDVLEHLHVSPRDLVNDLVSLLVPGGYLMIEVPNLVNIRKRIAVLLGRTNLAPFDSFYWWRGAWRGHVREFVKDDLVRLSNNLGLETVELRACDRMLFKVPRGLRSIYQVVTAVSPGWKDSWRLVGRKPEGWRPRKSLSDSEYRAMMGGLGPGASPE